MHLTFYVSEIRLVYWVRFLLHESGIKEDVACACSVSGESCLTWWAYLETETDHCTAANHNAIKLIATSACYSIRV